MLQLKSKGKKKPCSRSKAAREQTVSFAQGKVSLFVLVRPSSGWTRPTYIRDGNLLYLVY